MSFEIVFLPEVTADEQQAVLDFVNLWENESPVLSIHTSGSTGAPKKINVSKSVMVASAKATGHFFNFNSDCQNLLNLSADYIAGMMQIVRSIVFDMKLIVAPICSNPLEYTEAYRFDFAAFVPLQVQAIIGKPGTKKKYQQINNVIVGGAPLSSALFAEIEALENRTYATFGMTETVSHIALKLVKSANDYYVALPNVSFNVTQEDCLIINAPAISENSIVTNDRVELKDNYHFKWLGRADFTINSGGVKIQPEIVETKLANLIAEAFYISKKKDDLLGEQVVLVIEGIPYSDESQLLLTVEMLKKLDRFEVPKSILFKREFSRTSTGKLIREEITQ